MKGRSPYDDVVQGTGEADPREPLQLYDEKGRPSNPETKRITRDIIRSHNEVMQVIGVAEPDNSVLDPETELRLRQDEQEDIIGRRLMYGGRLIAVAGVWGVNGFRQRILVCVPHSTFSVHGSNPM